MLPFLLFIIKEIITPEKVASLTIMMESIQVVLLNGLKDVNEGFSN